MRGLAKFLPIVVGVGIGWLLFNPPAFLKEWGLIAYPAMILLAVVLFLAFAMVSISASLPEDLRFTPQAGTPLPKEMEVLGTHLAALGFEPAGPPYQVEITPPALLLSYVHPAERCYASIFRTGTVPAKTSYEFISVLHGDRGTLTTTVMPEAGALATPPQVLRQIVPHSTPAQAFEEHRRGVEFLKRNGIGADSVDAGSYVRRFQEAMRRGRKHFFGAPVRNTLSTVWRAATRSTPQLGPLERQKGIARQLQAIQTGRMG